MQIQPKLLLTLLLPLVLTLGCSSTAESLATTFGNETNEAMERREQNTNPQDRSGQVTSQDSKNGLINNFFQVFIDAFSDD